VLETFSYLPPSSRACTKTNFLKAIFYSTK
jgi:hypothetical protein